MVLLGILSTVADAATVADADGALAYARRTDAAHAAVVVDSRPRAACVRRTLAGARCLPIADFLGPHGRFVDPRGLLWLLGGAGLTGSEAVLVAGDDPLARDFVAGVLFLAGQRRVRVLGAKLSAVLDRTPAMAGAGTPRAMTRRVIFQAPMRDRFIVLRGELADRLARPDPPALLDGRSEKEYWGASIRGLRGGHIPGAEHLPVARLRANWARASGRIPRLSRPIAYAHNPLESIAYVTLLHAAGAIDARVYVEGWADWAAHTALPADSVTYPERVASRRLSKLGRAPLPWAYPAAAALAAVAIAAGGFYFGRRSA